MSLVLDIKKRYPGFVLDMQLEAGEERVALLGASGCGKSCTLRCIAGVETPDEGKIVVNGVTFFDSAAGINLSPQARKCALLFQNYQLFPNMTVADNVCAGVKDAGDAAARKKLAERYLSIFGLADFVDRYPARLSGGQQQRTAIARALAPNPKLLLLDEPLSALDAWTRSSIGEELREIQQKSGVTTLMVTHDRTEALALSDFIVVMNNGKIEQAGAPQTIYDSPESEFVATFVGGMNIVRLPAVNNGEPTGIRWGDVQVLLPTEASLAKPYTYVGQLEKCAFMGDNVRVELLLNDFKTLITADVPRFQPIARELTLKALYAVRLPLPGWRQWSEK